LKSLRANALRFGENVSLEGSGEALRFDTDRRIDRFAIAISALQPFDPL